MSPLVLARAVLLVVLLAAPAVLAADVYDLVFQSTSAINATVAGQGLQSFCLQATPPTLSVAFNIPSTDGDCQFSFSFAGPGQAVYQTCLTSFLVPVPASLVPLITAFYNNGGLQLFAASAVPGPTTPAPLTSAQTPVPTAAPTTNITLYSACPITTPVSSVCPLPNCSVVTSVANGSCVSKFGGSSVVACATQAATCAEYMTFDGMNCSNASAAVTYASLVCGACNLLALDGALPYYYAVQCGAASVTVVHGCDATCGTCSASADFIVGSCGWAPFFLTPDGFLAVSQLRPCTAVRATLYSAEGCPAANVTTSVVQEAGFCDMSDDVVGGSTIVCPGEAPQPVVTYPPQQPATLPPFTPVPVAPDVNTTVTVTTCSDVHCLQGCKAELHNQSQSTCIPLGREFARHRCTADNATSSCIGLVMFADAQCTQIADLFNVQCNSCFRFSNGGALRFNCAVGNSTFSIDSGCDADCEVCTTLGAVLPPTDCSAATLVEGGPSSYFVPGYPSYCRAVERIVFSDANCSEGSETGRVFVAQQQCDKSTVVECDGFVKPPPNPVTIEPLPDTPPANAVVAIEYTCTDVHCSTCTATDAYPDNTCHMPASRNTYQKVNCIPGVPSCVTVTAFSDSLCANITTIDSFVCDACNSNASSGTTLYACAAAGFTTHTGCTATCASCTAIAPLPYNKCVPGPTAGSFVIATPAADCFAYKIATYTEEDFMCNGTVTAIATLPQMLCADKRYVACPYNGFTPGPTVSHAPFTAAPVIVVPTSLTTITPAATNSPAATSPVDPSLPPAVTTTAVPSTVAGTTTSVPPAATTTSGPAVSATAAPPTMTGGSTTQAPTVGPPTTAGPTGSSPSTSAPPTTTAPPPQSTTSVAPSQTGTASPLQTTTQVPSTATAAPAATGSPAPAPAGYLTFNVSFVSLVASQNFRAALRVYFSNPSCAITVLASGFLTQRFYFSDSNWRQEQLMFHLNVVGNTTVAAQLGLNAASLTPTGAPPSPPAAGWTSTMTIIVAASAAGVLVLVAVVARLVCRRKGQLEASREYVSMQEYESGRLN
jgi:hypothetical protein